MSPRTVDDLSPECTVAQQPDYASMHDRCRRTEDIPLPGAIGVVLMPRCCCACHSTRPGR